MPAAWSLEDTLYLEELTRTSSVCSSFIEDSAFVSRTCSANLILSEVVSSVVCSIASFSAATLEIPPLMVRLLK